MVLLSGVGDADLSGWSYGALEASAVLPSFSAAHRAVVSRGSVSPLSAEISAEPDTGFLGREGPGTPTGPPTDLVPPFTGGAVGFMGYERGWSFAARARAPRSNPLGLPAEQFHRYDAIYAHHPATGQGLIITEGSAGAQKRGARLRAELAASPGSFPGHLLNRLQARVSRARHEAQIRAAQELIRQGEIYQVNLTYPLEGRFQGSPASALVRLGAGAPPFSAYLAVDDDAHIVSASPECFWDIHPSGRIRTFPIKGTRRRSPSASADSAHGEALLQDPKERAEHLMIVDLLRNDLSRVARPGSVRVLELAYLESFPTVHHLTSRIEAYLRPDLCPEDLCRALLPGGSITGAPKLRAMEVIDALEDEPRGVYTGNLTWIDHGGGMRASIAIRTAEVRSGAVRVGVGGGIVLDSSPAREWEETRLKAQALSEALGQP